MINYKDDNFIKEAIKRNHGNFDITIDLVGGKMLSACCEMLPIDGNIALVTEVPNQSDFDILFMKNASFHTIGANAYSLSEDPKQWINYQRILNDISELLRMWIKFY
ncbi:MAG: hypothetical protein ACXVDV_19990 [Bacteroidia bacterium]